MTHRRHGQAEARADLRGVPELHRLQRLRQGQGAAVVLQQDDRRAGGVAREREVFGVAVGTPGLLRVDVWLLEEPEFELHSQHARDGVVDDSFADEPAVDGLPVGSVLRVRRLKDDVEAGLPRVLRGRRRVGLRHVEDRGASCGRGVRDHEAGEAPRALEHVGEQPPVLGRRQAVKRVVGRHDRPRAGGKGGLERREVAFAEPTLVAVDGVAVAPALADVRHEVLGCRDDARALERRHEGARHLRGEVWVFAVRLLHAPPSHVVREVDDGREHLADAAAARLEGDGRGHAGHQITIEGGRERDRLRKDRRAVARQTVHGLVERNDRDVKARPLDEAPLDEVDAHRVLERRVTGALGFRRDLQPEHAARVVVGRVVEIARDHVELPELLLERHPPEKVADAVGHRQPRVAVRTDVALCRARSRQQQEERCGDDDPDADHGRRHTACERRLITHPRGC